MLNRFAPQLLAGTIVIVLLVALYKYDDPSSSSSSSGSSESESPPLIEDSSSISSSNKPLITTTTSSLSSPKNLARVVIIARHGDRSPMLPFAWDYEYNRCNSGGGGSDGGGNSAFCRALTKPLLLGDTGGVEEEHLWPEGYGHLTADGKRRMYRLGHYLKRRYGRLFLDRGRHYITPRDLYVRSSAVDRCLESAQLLTAGLCASPRNVWQWHSNLEWQPVAVQTVNRSQDGMLNPTSLCRIADQASERIVHSSIVGNGDGDGRGDSGGDESIHHHRNVQDFMQMHVETLTDVRSKLGLPLRDHREIRDLYDNIFCMKHANVLSQVVKRLQSSPSPSPSQSSSSSLVQFLLNTTDYHVLRSIYDISFRFDFTGQVEPMLRKLRAGWLLNEIISRLDPRGGDDFDDLGNVDAPRISLFVTHDSQLFHLFDALGFALSDSLHFGSTLVFESEWLNGGDPTTANTTKTASIGIRLYQYNVANPNERIQLKSLPLESVICGGGGANTTKNDPTSGNNNKNNNIITLDRLRQYYQSLLINDWNEWNQLCDGGGDGGGR